MILYDVCMKFEPESNQNGAEMPSKKKAYTAPRLENFGDFRALTMGGSNRSFPDGGARTTKNDN